MGCTLYAHIMLSSGPREGFHHRLDRMIGDLWFGLNIFYSGIEYTEKDCVRHKVRHYPLQTCDLIDMVLWTCLIHVNNKTLILIYNVSI